MTIIFVFSNENVFLTNVGKVDEGHGSQDECLNGLRILVYLSNPMGRSRYLKLHEENFVLLFVKHDENMEILQN